MHPLAAWLVLLLSVATADHAARPATNPTTYAIVPSSRFEVRTGKAGLLGAFGHEHVIRAREFDGTIVYDPARLHASRVELGVAVASLFVVPRGADRKDAQDVERSMFTDVLHPARYPRIRFASRIVGPAEDGVRVLGDLTIEGRTRPVALDVRLDTRGDTLRARGSFRVRQSDFGIEPYRAAGGTIRVADEITFDFEALATPR